MCVLLDNQNNMSVECSNYGCWCKSMFLDTCHCALAKALMK